MSMISRMGLLMWLYRGIMFSLRTVVMASESMTYQPQQTPFVLGTSTTQDVLEAHLE
jgi:hypothetical protein